MTLCSYPEDQFVSAPGEEASLAKALRNEIGRHLEKTVGMQRPREREGPERAGKRIYICGAKQTSLHHRLGQGKNSVLKPLIKR